MKNILCLPDYDDGDVISFSSCMHKIGKFKTAIDVSFADNKLAYAVSNAIQSKIGVSSLEWFENGVSCEVLRLGGKSWQKGKLKITINVEFCPEQLVIEETVNNQIEINQSNLPLVDIKQIISNNQKNNI